MPSSISSKRTAHDSRVASGRGVPAAIAPVAAALLMVAFALPSSQPATGDERLRLAQVEKAGKAKAAAKKANAPAKEAKEAKQGKEGKEGKSEGMPKVKCPPGTSPAPARGTVGPGAAGCI